MPCCKNSEKMVSEFWKMKEKKRKSAQKSENVHEK
jgi:hypothetical protein